MLSSVWEDVKREYNYGNMITRIIIINVSIFVLINLVRIILWASNGGVLPGIYKDIVHFLSMSSDGWFILTHPWVIITSIFLHEGLWHILFNMLFLYWFGRIVGDFIGNHRILPIYLLGGLIGNAFFFLSANLFAYGGDATIYALGASGGVMAIVVASGTLSPDYRMRLILIGEVKLKYIVLVLVFLDLIGLASNVNTGGHFAHLGGAMFGWFFIHALRQGIDLSEGVNRILRKLNPNIPSSPAKKPKQSKVPFMVFKNKEKTKDSAEGSHSSDSVDHQKKLDAILEKIKASGYESLSQEEKEFLFQASKK